MAPRVLLAVCVIAMLMLSAARANVVTSCSEDFRVGGCNDTDGCDYNVTYTADGDSVTFTATYRIDGWVGIGITPDEFMPGPVNIDGVVGAVDVNDDFFVEDVYLNNFPGDTVLDASQDITDTSAWSGNGIVGIEFTRPRVTPESNDEDVSLGQPVYFVFARGIVIDFATRNRSRPVRSDVQASPVQYYIPPNCVDGVADCGLLVDPANGNITYSDGTVEGSVATYMCDPEFELEGEPTRNCGSNGEWTGDAVTCAGAGMIQASLLVMALMVIVATFGF